MYYIEQKLVYKMDVYVRKIKCCFFFRPHIEWDVNEMNNKSIAYMQDVLFLRGLCKSTYPFVCVCHTVPKKKDVHYMTERDEEDGYSVGSRILCDAVVACVHASAVLSTTRDTWGLFIKRLSRPSARSSASGSPPAYA